MTPWLYSSCNTSWTSMMPDSVHKMRRCREKGCYNVFVLECAVKVVRGGASLMKFNSYRDAVCSRPDTQAPPVTDSSGLRRHVSLWFVRVKRRRQTSSVVVFDWETFWWDAVITRETSAILFLTARQKNSLPQRFIRCAFRPSAPCRHPPHTHTHSHTSSAQGDAIFSEIITSLQLCNSCGLLKM